MQFLGHHGKTLTYPTVFGFFFSCRRKELILQNCFLFQVSFIDLALQNKWVHLDSKDI